VLSPKDISAQQRVRKFHTELRLNRDHKHDARLGGHPGAVEISGIANLFD